MSDLAKEWEDRHTQFQRVDTRSDDPGRTAFVEWAVEQASRVPLFATLNKKNASAPSWKGPSHSLTVHIPSEDESGYSISAIVLRTPLINLEINRRATREFSHLDLFAEDPEAYMRTVLAPMIGDDTPVQSEDDLLDSIAVSWVNSGSLEQDDPELFCAGSKYLGPASHPEMPSLPVCVKAYKKTQELNILIIPEPIMCSPWEWSPIDLMTRIARHHKRRGN